jgi:hypothetical protein
MFKGSVYVHHWTYKDKRRKAWGIRYRIDGGPLVRKIVADTKDGADAELDACGRSAARSSSDYPRVRLSPIWWSPS